MKTIRAAMRLLAPALLLLLVGAPLAPASAEPLELTGTPLLFDPSDPARERIGALAWRGGLEITSANKDFGGLSGLSISPDGAGMTAIGDMGRWFTARLTYDGKGHLAGMDEGKTGQLHGPTGEHLDHKRDQDAESLARLADGSLVVAFERQHRLWRYPPRTNPLAGNPLAGHPAPIPTPQEFNDLRSNSGIEALARLSNGSLLALAEGKKEADESPAFLGKDGKWLELHYRHEIGFRPSGAARLPGGGLLIMERSFNIIDGVAIRLRRLTPAAIAAGMTGTVIEAETIATLRPPLSLDNLEGIALRQAENGETLVYLVSDDNFNPVQRSLLLMFALEE